MLISQSEFIGKSSGTRPRNSSANGNAAVRHRVNDTHGHLVGDSVLIHTAERIKSAVRDFDMVGRFGGEEFTVILTYADMALARVIAERIRQDVAGTPFHAKGHIIEVTISLGVAMLRPGETRESILERAGVAMYEAKKAGRECWWLKTSNRQQALQRGNE
jgi:two-component system, cell cycle response regulator